MACALFGNVIIKRNFASEFHSRWRNSLLNRTVSPFAYLNFHFRRALPGRSHQIGETARKATFYLISYLIADRSDISTLHGATSTEPTLFTFEFMRISLWLVEWRHPAISSFNIEKFPFFLIVSIIFFLSKLLWQKLY
jgi:hypothetical protein